MIGIIGLLFFTPYIEPKEVKINEIDNGMIEEEVVISGVIEDVKKSSTSNSYFLTINDGTGKLSVILFESAVVELEDSNTPIELFLNKKVKVGGTLTQYKSSMELILSNGNSIKIINS
jgi:DNA/RNA endonuclease YhcR with UshA esterase domain